ncbi:hypothetical protein LENED_006988 [Lentinula edodes]|uniref:Uncharacterized protein n=1 Tax=Lentinula edodes TaxID=5353 RepID=A0A1Q3EDA1_LENED|nr:hypothetical protein LENED_006988 [Lentinula edodes]
MLSHSGHWITCIVQLDNSGEILWSSRTRTTPHILTITSMLYIMAPFFITNNVSPVTSLNSARKKIIYLLLLSNHKTTTLILSGPRIAIPLAGMKSLLGQQAEWTSYWDLQAPVRSHKRTPSATFRWTREILKKMRLTGATSTSDFEPPPCPEISATIEPSKAATFLYNGSFADDKASNSSLLSSSSSGSYPALESITISLSSSSDFDGSLEDSDTDSDSDSLKEIDLGDGMAARARMFTCLTSSRDSGPNNPRQQQTETSGSILEDFARSSLPPLTIHPRWGDIVRINFATTYSSAVACTETWCMHTDRYLLVGMGLGLWTIRKVLWLSELNRICAIPRPREEEEEEEAEGEKTFVVDDESKDPISGSCAEICSISDDNDSLSEEDEDSEEGEVMYSSVVSLASLISTTTSSEDSDVTLVESDSDSEAPLNASSMSDFVAQAEPQLSGRSVDFDKTCSSSGILADEDEEEDFEEVDLGLGCGSSDAACSSSLSGSSNTSVDICCPERESLALLRTLYFDSHAVSSSMVTKDYAMSNAQGKWKLEFKSLDNFALSPKEVERITNFLNDPTWFQLLVLWTTTTFIPLPRLRWLFTLHIAYTRSTSTS